MFLSCMLGLRVGGLFESVLYYGNVSFKFTWRVSGLLTGLVWDY